MQINGISYRIELFDVKGNMDVIKIFIVIIFVSLQPVSCDDNVTLCDDFVQTSCVWNTTTTPSTTSTTANTKTRRRRTRMRRTKTTSTLSPNSTTVTPEPTLKGGLTQAQLDAYNYMMFVWKFQNFYCYKWTECINDHLYFERYPARLCGRDWISRTLVYFDHLCTLWRANCKGLGMFFHKHRALCDRSSPPVQVFMDFEYVDPPELVIFSVTSGFGGGRK